MKQSLFEHQSDCYVCHRIARLVSPTRKLERRITASKDTLEVNFYILHEQPEQFTITNLSGQLLKGPFDLIH